MLKNVFGIETVRVLGNPANAKPFLTRLGSNLQEGTCLEPESVFEDDESLNQKEIAQRTRRVSSSDDEAAQRTIALVQRYSKPQPGLEREVRFPRLRLHPERSGDRGNVDSLFVLLSRLKRLCLSPSMRQASVIGRRFEECSFCIAACWCLHDYLLQPVGSVDRNP